MATVVCDTNYVQSAPAEFYSIVTLILCLVAVNTSKAFRDFHLCFFFMGHT